FLDGAIAATDGPARRILEAISEGEPGASAAALSQVCLPIYGRALDAMLRDTISPNVVHAGVKFNVIPGEAVLDVDVRRLPDLGVPTFGFSPLRQPPEETYLERWHAVDERVSLAGLRWGLPVLYDAVRRFCG